MIKEHIKAISAVISILSVATALYAASESVARANAESVFSPVRTISWATFGAALAAALSIFASRGLRRERAKGRIFLLHAREDTGKARLLYQALKEAGFRPWLDSEDIRPGERWAKAVREALEGSPAALVLVSGALNTSQGFVRRELRMALALLGDQTEGNSPVIPVRLVESEVPEPLRDVQWVDLFREDGFDRLREALEQRGL